MTYRVHITGQAERDLDRALDYIEFSLKNPKASDGLLDMVENTLSVLAHMPERYAVVDDALLSAWRIRFVQIKKYLAFFVTDQETQTVHIVRFLYGKSDWRSILHGRFTTE